MPARAGGSIAWSSRHHPRSAQYALADYRAVAAESASTILAGQSRSGPCSVQRPEAGAKEPDARRYHVLTRPQEYQGLLHALVQIAGVGRGVAGRAASARRQRKVPAHR